MRTILLLVLALVSVGCSVRGKAVETTPRPIRYPTLEESGLIDAETIRRGEIKLYPYDYSISEPDSVVSAPDYEL